MKTNPLCFWQFSFFFLLGLEAQKCRVEMCGQMAGGQPADLAKAEGTFGECTQIASLNSVPWLGWSMESIASREDLY